MTAYVYPDAKWSETLALVDRTSPYALTGAVFAPRPPGGARGDAARCATPPATSTSTTSRPARWSGSSRSAARADRDERQGRLEAEPAALGQRAHDQGDVLSAADYRYPFMAEEWGAAREGAPVQIFAAPGAGSNSKSRPQIGCMKTRFPLHDGTTARQARRREMFKRDFPFRAFVTSCRRSLP